MATREMTGLEGLRRGLKVLIGRVSGAERLHLVLTNRGHAVGVVVPWEWYQEASRKMRDPFDMTLPVPAPPDARTDVEATSA